MIFAMNPQQGAMPFLIEEGQNIIDAVLPQPNLTCSSSQQTSISTSVSGNTPTLGTDPTLADITPTLEDITPFSIPFSSTS